MKAIQCDYFVLDNDYLLTDNINIGKKITNIVEFDYPAIENVWFEYGHIPDTKIVNGYVLCLDGRLIGIQRRSGRWILDDILTGDEYFIHQRVLDGALVRSLIARMEEREKHYSEMTAKFKKIIDEAYEKRPYLWNCIEEVAEVERI